MEGEFVQSDSAPDDGQPGEGLALQTVPPQLQSFSDGDRARAIERYSEAAYQLSGVMQEKMGVKVTTPNLQSELSASGANDALLRDRLNQQINETERLRNQKFEDKTTLKKLQEILLWLPKTISPFIKHLLIIARDGQGVRPPIFLTFLTARFPPLMVLFAVHFFYYSVCKGFLGFDSDSRLSKGD